MNVTEIRTMRQTCRAKVEDLLGRTSSREMSTEETQMLSDLKAEGERLGSLESRYAVLESFDKGTTQPIIHRPIAPTDTDRKAAIVKALDGFLAHRRNGLRCASPDSAIACVWRGGCRSN